MGVGLYITDNPATDDLLADASRHGFRPDHVAYFHHSIVAKQYMGDLDETGYARLNTGILREWIQPRAFGRMKNYLVVKDVLLIAPYSKGHFSTGYRVQASSEVPE